MRFSSLLYIHVYIYICMYASQFLCYLQLGILFGCFGDGAQLMGATTGFWRRMWRLNTGHWTLGTGHWRIGLKKKGEVGVGS